MDRKREFGPGEMRAVLAEFFGTAPEAGTAERARWDEFTEQTTAMINRWLGRGDGVAVYRNAEIGHRDCGELRFASYGSTAAQLETDTPPQQLPDTPTMINWRFQLSGTYRGPELRAGLEPTG